MTVERKFLNSAFRLADFPQQLPQQSQQAGRSIFNESHGFSGGRHSSMIGRHKGSP
jgi:hypothetical protein